jgi:hypothetical protein
MLECPVKALLRLQRREVNITPFKRDAPIE